ncbi:MAG: hypothetical protein FJ271_31110 [Planctomycetes bacterium]|nr:hypothetical protein [Planctomycetota bacterium]
MKAGELPGKGKAKKELFILSPAGIQAVLAQTDPKPILESLRAGLERIESQSANIVGEVRGNLIAVLETVKTTLLGALEPLAALRDLTSIKQSISQVLERIKPVDVGQFVNKASGPVQSDAADDQWLEVVLRMAADQRQMNPFQRLTLPQIFERLKGERLNLSLGQFHDGLRRLHQQNRIRLGPFTQALATLDDPRNALYLDREVKYYVELP